MVRGRSVRVLFIAPSAYPLGGVAVWLDDVVQGLRSRGMHVQVGLVSGIHHAEDRYRKIYPALEPIVRICNRTGTRYGRILALKKVVAQQDPDLVVGINIPDTFDAVNLLRQSGNRLHIVMAVHGIQQDLLNDVRHYQEVLDGVIVTNRLTSILIERMSEVLKERIQYAPYGVDLARYRIARQSGQAENVPTVLWVGRLEEPQKRVLDLPSIARETISSGMDCRFLIVGDGPEGGTLRSQVNKMGIGDRFEFVKFVSKERIPNLYKKAQLLLLTSTWETGPIVVWEAMAAGLPVVTSRYIGCGREGALVDGMNCLMFDVGDVSDAANQIRRLMGNPDLCRQLARSGVELIKKRYSLEASVDAWAHALERTMGYPPRGPKVLQRPSPAGRLDRWFGIEAGERLRSMWRKRYRARDAGDEWPHTISKGQNELMFSAKSLDFVEEK